VRYGSLNSRNFGFRTVVMQDIRITIGFRAQVNAELEVSTIQETVTVTGESPLVDTRQTHCNVLPCDEAR
jgi:hypothetical protein